MKKTMAKNGILILAALTLLLPFTVLDALAQAGPGTGGPDNGQGYGQQGWNCPYCGARHGPGMMGPGMMGPGMQQGQSGRSMGRGMMGPGMQQGQSGRSMGRGMRRGYYDQQYGPQYQQEPLNQDQAESMIQNQYGLLRNPNLQIGDIEDKGDYFQAEIVTKDNSLVDELRVDKNTGDIRSRY